MAWVFGISLGGVALVWIAWNLTLDALWQPTDRGTVERILLLGEVRPGEHVVDLGCGDGRIVVAAARRFGAQATGVEIDPLRVLWARVWILLSGISESARIVRGNMYSYDTSGADVVILFLSATSNFKLQDRLRKRMKPGSRIVSYYHPMWGWTPDVIGEATGGHPIYVYRMRGDGAQDAR